MKKILCMLLVLVVTMPVFSQESSKKEKKSGDPSEIKTIFGKKEHNGKIPLGYFMELSGGYTKFGQKDLFLPGFSAGVILNHSWTVGLAGFMVIQHQLYYPDFYYNATEKTMEGVNLMGGYGGALFEYTLMPKSRVHVAFPLIIGGGYLAYIDKNEQNDQGDHSNHWNHWNYTTVSSDYFFVVEPGVRVEFNIIKHLRLGAGISYRYTPDLNLENTSPAMINQFNAKLTLRFGKF
jgi:hypothetical protein